MKWAHTLLEIVGLVAIVLTLGYLYMSWAFRDFAGGGNCETPPFVYAKAPDGKHTVQESFVQCGGSNKFTHFKISTGNPNPGYEYREIVELLGADPEKAKMTWLSSDSLLITYPNGASVEEAYAKIFGTTIIVKADVEPDSSNSRR